MFQSMRIQGLGFCSEERPSMSQAYKKADVAFIGQVIEFGEQRVPEFAQEWIDTTSATFDLHTLLKGSAQFPFKVNNYAKCPIYFEQGKDYIVFVRRSKAEAYGYETGFTEGVWYDTPDNRLVALGLVEQVNERMYPMGGDSG